MNLIAKTALRQGQEITVPPHNRIISDYEGDGHLYEVTFDGGADRHQQVAGAAAILWHRRDIDYMWKPMAGLEISLPNESSAPGAEAWGAHAAFVCGCVSAIRRHAFVDHENHGAPEREGVAV